MKKRIIFLLVVIIAINNTPVNAQPEAHGTAKDKLAVVWTSNDPDIAEMVVLLYTHAAKTNLWFDEVVLIIWGPSSKLVAENTDVQNKLKSMLKDGVIIEACVVCAENYGVAEDLRKLGFVVKGMGEPLSDYLKSDFKVLTF